MLLDVVASERHFADHLAAIWEHVPAEARGTFWAPQAVAARVPGAQAYVDHKDLQKKLGHSGGLVLVAAFGDLRKAAAAGRPAVLSEHGAGQAYQGVRHTSYAGGPGRENVQLLLVPGPRPAERNRLAYPGIPQREVGCPKLDPWHQGRRVLEVRPTVAISFHWDCKVCPETRSAFPAYREELASLLGLGWQVLGHAHPRILGEVAPVYRGLGIEVVEDFADVLDRAHVYACDNSSTIFEFASTGRPVVLLNCNHYRRSVNHGLRFWSEADVGIQASPGGLAEAIRLALKDAPAVREARYRAVARVYTSVDGRAGYRAAHAILEVLSTMQEAQEADAPSSVAMRALKSYSGHEGKIRPGDPVYPGFRRTAKGYERVFGVNIELRAKQLEAGGFAQRTPGLPPTIEDKRLRPESSAENKASVTLNCTACGEKFGSISALRLHRTKAHP